MMLRSVAILTLAVCAAAFGQTSAPQTGAPRSAKKTPAKQAAPAKQAEPTRWPIQGLTVEGNHDYSKEQILAVAGLKVGQLAGKTEFDAARDRLELGFPSKLPNLLGKPSSMRRATGLSQPAHSKPSVIV